MSQARPTGVWNEELAWARLGAAAVRAKDETGPDVDRVREALQLFIRLRGHGADAGAALLLRPVRRCLRARWRET